MAIDERTWWQEHPEPQVTQTAERLVLWNYPVAKTELADVHAAAIRTFLGPLFLAPELTGRRLSICGHASGSGEAGSNVQLARDRADHVAAFLRSLRFQGFEVGSSGSSQPADSAPTAQALARNRRVELTKTIRDEITPEPTRVPIDERIPTAAKPEPDKTGAALFFEYEAEIPLGTLTTPTTEAEFTAVVKGKGKVVRGDGAVAAGISGKNGGIAAKFEKKLAEHLKGKVGIDPGQAGKPPTAKVSIAGEAWGFPVEEGFQTKLKFVYMKVTLGTLKLPELDLDSAVVSLEFSLDVKVEIGPSKALLARLGVSAGAVGAVSVGVIGVTAVIIGGIIYASEASKQRFLLMVVDAANRDGAASRVAYECLGATSRVAAAFNEHRLALSNAGGQTSREGFEEGSRLVAAYLGSLKGERDARMKELKEKYAKDRNELDFELVRAAVFSQLGPYESQPTPLDALIRSL